MRINRGMVVAALVWASVAWLSAAFAWAVVAWPPPRAQAQELPSYPTEAQLRYREVTALEDIARILKRMEQKQCR